jgi:hypothetical protein
MEQFWMGCLAALVILFIMATVVGMVYVVKIWGKLKEFDLSLGDVWRQLSERENDIRRDMDDRFNSERKETESMVDSRLDKLENKLKVSK